MLKFLGPVTIAMTYAAAAGIVALSATPSKAAIVSWQSSSALTPDQISPAYSLFLGGAGPNPTLSAAGLNISTTGPGANSAAYLQSDPLVDFVGSHEIRFEMQLVSTSQTQVDRTASGITFTTQANIGQSLFIDNGQAFFISGSGNGVGNSFALDTSIFHDYRIAISGTASGSLVSLFVDGALKLQDSLFASAGNFGATERVAFGEFSSAAFGESNWKSFVHDAGVPTPVPLPAAFPLFAGGLGLLGFLNWRRQRKPVAA